MDLMKLPLLSLLIWSSILGGALLLFLKPLQNKVWSQRLALVVAVFGLLLCGFLFQGFDATQWQMQWTENLPWIPKFGIGYTLGVDGFSLPLIALTCLMTVLVVWMSPWSVKENNTQYLSAFLIMQGLICGALAAIDGILFYVFWEAMLVPMFLIIGIWGGKNRIYATLKFFLYTFLGSVLFLVALIYLYFRAQEAGVDSTAAFNILNFQHLPLSIAVQKAIFLAFFFAFAIKVPMWPLHTWLPDAHVEAPTGGSVILAAILLKMGGYGFLRFMLPIVPDACRFYAIPMIALSLIAIVYIGLVAIVQKDMKKLIAYSSISHMGFVTLGFFIAYVLSDNTNFTKVGQTGIEGGMVQMISHGFISGALFFCVGVLYDRHHSRLIKDYGGVVNAMPIFAAFFMLFAMANVGLPGTSGFVGEFLVILASYQANIGFAMTAALILVLGAAYTLWMYKRVIFGAATQTSIAVLPDLSRHEKFIFLVLALFVLGLGLWPAPLLKMLHGSTEHLVTQMMQVKGF